MDLLSSLAFPELTMNAIFYRNVGGYGDWSWCKATVTNLSYQQSFSEMFVMTATRDVTWQRPIFVFGEQSSPELAELSTNAIASDLERRYEGRKGVQDARVFDNFDYDEKFLEGGAKVSFRIDTGGYGDRLTIAAGLPFTNDGAWVLEHGHVYDGAEYFVNAIDTGDEGNIQTCWSVAAKQDDFPVQSECADNDDADDNDDRIPGENFVHHHRGMHDLDGGDDLEDMLQFEECDDFDDLEDCNSGSDCLATYFYEVGFDDEALLCRVCFLSLTCVKSNPHPLSIISFPLSLTGSTGGREQLRL